MSDSIKSKSELTNDVHITTRISLADMYEEDGSIDPSYQAKARLLNEAMQEIGMGKYQVQLFFVAGMGWFA